MWRVLTSDKLRVTLGEIDREWSFDDLMTAHDVLDALELAEAEAAPDRAAKRGRRG